MNWGRHRRTGWWPAGIWIFSGFLQLSEHRVNFEYLTVYFIGCAYLLEILVEQSIRCVALDPTYINLMNYYNSTFLIFHRPFCSSLCKRIWTDVEQNVIHSLVTNSVMVELNSKHITLYSNVS